jgi:serine protease Do
MQGTRKLFTILFLTYGCLFPAQAVELPDFTSIINKHAPAIVNISTTKLNENINNHPALPQIPENAPAPFQEFFKKFFEERGSPIPFETKSLGSGFVITEDGYIVTNHHVIQSAGEIIVRFHDKRELRAEIIGSDSKSDIALLKVASKNLQPVQIGKSSNLKVGQWVLAIGSPFGFDQSVTAGIVSAKNRTLDSTYIPFIQTDVAINPGNSGGPLLDLDGNVVGVNAQILSRTGGYMGLSFSIPIDMTMDVISQIQTKGKVTRGWLGVYIQEVTRELAESFGMQKPAGALVAKIMPGSPAANSDIKIGDVILTFDGKTIENSRALPPMVGETKIGRTVKLNILRKKNKKTIKVKIAELKEEEVKIAKIDDGKTARELILGMHVRNLTPQDKEKFGVNEDAIFVVAISKGPGKRAGIVAGDIIKMVDGVKIINVKTFKNTVTALPKGKYVSLLIQRSSNTQFLALKKDD